MLWGLPRNKGGNVGAEGVNLRRRVDDWAVHIFREHNTEADAGRGVRGRKEEWENDSKVVWAEVTGFCGFWDGSCRDDVNGAGLWIKIFTHALEVVHNLQKVKPLPDKNSLDAECFVLIASLNDPCESPGESIDIPFDEYEFTPIKKQNSIVNRLRKYGLAPRRDLNESGPGFGASQGNMSVVSQDGHDREKTEQVDWIVWAMAGDDVTSSVTSGSFSRYMGDEWKKWRNVTTRPKMEYKNERCIWDKEEVRRKKC